MTSKLRYLFVRARQGALFAILPVCVATAAAAEPRTDLAGAWTVTATVAEGSVAAELELTRRGEAYVGNSGPLDALLSRPLDWSGAAGRNGLHLVARTMGRDVGFLDLRAEKGGLAGTGVLYGTPVRVAASRPEAAAAGPPRTLEYPPTQYHPLTSAIPAPVLRVRPGDLVRTSTIDPYGLDAHDASVSMPGNPGTGPFYVEGALPGDTVGIQIVSLRPNRSTARMNNALDPAAVDPRHVQTPGAISDPFWTLDPARGVASLRTPSEKLKGFTVPLRPMLGVVTVALPGGRATANRDLGEWGGNLDYPEVREGVTLYLPVYQPGALIFMGDAHARQGDGEVAGQGLETSMAVEFRVTLIKHQALPQPWAENADHVMVSGIAGSMDGALRRATSGLAAWLKRTYQLDDSEVAAVLGTSIEYDVAEVVSANFHVVAKLRKDVLAQIPKLQ